MDNNQDVVWEPTPKQSEFLACNDFEVLFGGSAGGGKLLRLDTPVPTPTGWTTMGELNDGDIIFSELGEPIQVLHAFAVDERPESFKLTFDDGSTMDACAHHKWLTFNAKELSALTRHNPEWRAKRRARRPSQAAGRKSAAFTAQISTRNAAKPPYASPTPTGSVRSTAEIFATLRTSSGRTNHAIPLTKALQCAHADLPVDPYVLGAWLGDGTTLSGGFTGIDPEIWQEIEGAGYEVTHSPTSSSSHHIRGLAPGLRALGLLGNKHVPAMYLRASQAQRLALLQGLMDTDGTVTDNGSAEFTNTNRSLADAVYELLVSLGWKAQLMESRATLYGKDCGPKYDIKWTPDCAVFRLPRKADKQRLATRRTTKFRYVVDCQPIDPVPMRCIAVDNPTGLFLAGRQMVVTHNSDAMLIDAWCGQYGGPTNPNHRAIIFRRTYGELEDLIDRSHALYPNFIEGAKYNKVEHIWRTPWGAKLQLGHMNHDNDRFKHRGRAYNYIGHEELTLWPTDTCYRYLQSRLRTTDRTLPRYLRSNTNPDGPGQKWVMKRFGIEKEGNASRIAVPTEFEEQDANGNWGFVQRLVVRSFIPSRLSDNPHLRGTGYRETLMDMEPDEREALLMGLWNGNQVKGSFYFNEMQRARADARIGQVPSVTGVPVNTFWDLGMNDTTAIWFHQGMGMTNRFVRCYENSGEGIEHYAQILQQFAKEYRYVYGTHYLPHDAAHTTLASAGKMVIQLFREALPGHKFVTVPRTPHLIVGINQTRKVFGNCYFDADACADGLAALDAYRKKYNDQLGAFTNAHVHDWSSNYADAFRQFGQGFEPAQKHVKPPEWHKKLHSMTKNKRSPQTS